MNHVAVIPARNEASRVMQAVLALRSQGAHVLVVANGCDDATADVATRAGATVIEQPVLAGGVGQARRIGAAAALELWPDMDMLVSTDADCRLAPGALASLHSALSRADAAMGRVVPDPEEFASLADHVREHGLLEDRRDALLGEICALSVPEPHDPMPRHVHAAGALMGFRPAAYRSVGGFAPLSCHEDRELHRRMIRSGLRVAHPWHAGIIASCRLRGRAPGGMADTIAARTVTNLEAEIRLLRRQCDRLACQVTELRRDGWRASARLAPLMLPPLGGLGRRAPYPDRGSTYAENAAAEDAFSLAAYPATVRRLQYTPEPLA